LQDCPTCNQPTFKKQLTAAGFQLKGSGWYATDFKSNGSAPTAAAAPADASKSAAETSAPADSKPDSKPAPAATPATPPAASSS
jgi:predicted nucleic acid-binding Zn ribbon protein